VWSIKERESTRIQIQNIQPSSFAHVQHHGLVAQMHSHLASVDLTLSPRLGLETPLAHRGRLCSRTQRVLIVQRRKIVYRLRGVASIGDKDYALKGKVVEVGRSLGELRSGSFRPVADMVFDDGWLRDST